MAELGIGKVTSDLGPDPRLTVARSRAMPNRLANKTAIISGGATEMSEAASKLTAAEVARATT
jgi:hypothetical protein